MRAAVGMGMGMAASSGAPASIASAIFVLRASGACRFEVTVRQVGSLELVCICVSCELLHVDYGCFASPAIVRTRVVAVIQLDGSQFWQLLLVAVDKFLLLRLIVSILGRGKALQ